MDLNALRCRRCGAAIETRDVHEDLAIAKCRYCSAVMDLSLRDVAIVPGQPVQRPPRRPAVPIPERFTVQEHGGVLAIEWKWFTLANVFLLVFCGFWDSILVFWYAGAGAQKDVPIAFFLFPLIHVAVGVGLTWTALAGLLNKTRIEVERGVMRIRHGPLPWPGNRDLRTDDIEQLFCDESVHRGKNSTTYTYNLHAVVRGSGKRIKLIGRLQKPDVALFLEQKLESHLGIRDIAIQGELSKRR